MTEDTIDYVAKLKALPKHHDFFIGIVQMHYGIFQAAPGMM
jgi:hypothetical protein